MSLLSPYKDSRQLKSNILKILKKKQLTEDSDISYEIPTQSGSLLFKSLSTVIRNQSTKIIKLFH